MGYSVAGAHSVGITHCSFFHERLWNFEGTCSADPSMDPNLVMRLKAICPQQGVGLGSPVNLDQATPNIMDNTFYNQLIARKGILQLDQRVATDRTTTARVNVLASPRSTFTAAFAASLIRLGNVRVIEGSGGEIRKICSRIN